MRPLIVGAVILVFWLAVRTPALAESLYWNSGGAIHRRDITGGDIQVLTSTNQPNGVALDLLGRTIFWTDAAAGKIQTAPLAGGEARDVLSKLADPTAIAILAETILGDADGDGFVNFADLGILLKNYDQHAGDLTAAAPVPEPTTMVLALLCVIALPLAARGKRG